MPVKSRKLNTYREEKMMEGWKCEWDDNCPNKAIKQLWRYDFSKPPIMGDSFASRVALPPMPQTEYIKVCEAHLLEASTLFFNEVSGWINPLDRNSETKQ